MNFLPYKIVTVSCLTDVVSVFSGFFPAIAPTLTLHQKLQLMACGSECKGLLVSMAFKLVLLAAGAWGGFLRRPRATMPRIFLFRAAILVREIRKSW